MNLRQRQRQRALRRPFALGVVALVVALSGCERSTGIASTTEVPTTFPLLPPPEDPKGIAAGSEAAREIERSVAELVKVDDACELLTRTDLDVLQVDAAAFLSSSARAALARGAIDIFDHLYRLIPDDAARTALVTQRDAVVDVLDVVERSAANPLAPQVSQEIEEIMSAPQLVTAVDSLALWVYAHCE